MSSLLPESATHGSITAASAALEECKASSAVNLAEIDISFRGTEVDYFLDQVQLINFPVSQMYKLDCCFGHRFAYETLYSGIKTALRDDLIPACPLANHPDHSQRCNYLLSQLEIEQILNRYKPPSKLDLEDRKLWKFKRGRLIDGSLGWVSEKVDDAFLRKGKIDMGCIECPNGRCGYWVEPCDSGVRQKVDCPKCLNSFCSLCKRTYHYRCECDQVMTIAKQWLEWQQNGRGPYLEQMAREDASYQSALDVSKLLDLSFIDEVSSLAYHNHFEVTNSLIGVGHFS